MDEKQISEGMAYLIEVDADIALALTTYGSPPSRIRPQGFKTLLSIIVSQQISTNVAQVIMQRMVDLLPELSAPVLLATDETALREVGMSGRKIDYAKSLAAAICSGKFDIDALETLSDEQAIQQITALRGLGRWSAEIYLMFSLQRQDLFPAADLALLVALGRLKNLDSKPTPKQAHDLVAHWAPWRSVGSLFLWHYYRGAPA